MKDFKPARDREYLTKRMGDVTQLAGLRKFELTNGMAKGVEAVDFRTGTGFEFTVLPGRGMDIAWAAYKGVPICFMGKSGVVSPSYYESAGFSWLRSFFGGLLTTCGLTNVGVPCDDALPESQIGLRHYGLHGRVSNTCAENFGMCEEWRGNDFFMGVTGKMREAITHGEKITLKREVSAAMGESRLTIKDTVENEGYCDCPLMLLYHINLGYPVLDEGSRVIYSVKGAKPADAFSKECMGERERITAPIKDIYENCYFLDPNAEEDGTALAGLVNDRLDVGVYIKFNKNQLPRLTQWKEMGEGDYVLGLEPGLCHPLGRVKQRETDGLEMLKPGEKKNIEVEIGILADASEIKAFTDRVARLG